MLLAQKLYESGNITYMRTDSVNLSDTALQDIEAYVGKQFGNKYQQQRKYKNKNEMHRKHMKQFVRLIWKQQALMMQIQNVCMN